jgi:endonuclease G
MSNLQLKAEQALAGILSRDPRLAREIAALRAEDAMVAGAESLATALEGFTEDAAALGRVAQEYRVARPVLTVRGPELMPVKAVDAVGKTWQKRLKKAGRGVRTAIDAVGRIEVEGNGDVKVAGTGFMVRKDVIATNQHVAAQFAENGDAGAFRFRLNLGGREMAASIDFIEELGVNDSLSFRIVEVLHMEMDVIPDVAFLRVDPESEGKPLPRPLQFSTGKVRQGQRILVIGYPERDTREKHARAMDAIFGDIFDKKRVSPGQVRRIDPDGRVVHDCSVLRGNSGSPLVSLATGKVVGIHAVGEFLEDNFAVPAAAAETILARVLAAAKTAKPAEPLVVPASGAPGGSVPDARTGSRLGDLAVPSAKPGRASKRRRAPQTA